MGVTAPRAALALLRPRTVRVKLVLVIALVITIISAFVFLFFPARLEQQARRALIAKAQSVGAITAFAVRSAVLFNDRAAMRDALRGALVDDDLVYIAVSDATGRIVALQHSGLAVEGDAHATEGAALSPSVHRTSVPIEFEGSVLGEVHVGTSLKGLGSEVLRSRRVAALASVLILVLGTGAIVVTGSLITRPLRRIADTAKRIADGDLTQRADHRSHDEVGLLAGAFNVMVDRLQLANRDLEQVNRRLESRVEQRTREWRIASSERRRAEAERSAVEQFYEQILNDLPAQVAVFDRDMRYVYANPSTAVDPELRSWIIGRTAAEHWERTGMSAGDIRHLCETMAACVADRVVGTVEHTVGRADGEHRTYIRSFSPMLDEEGEVWRLIGYGLDVTDRRAAERALRESEEQFRQAQKMEAVGRLAAGVAHDFNNLLTVINGHSSLLLMELDEDDDKRASVEDIAAAGSSAASLTQQLLAFSRKQVMQPKILDLNEIMEHVSKLLCRLLGEDVDVVMVPSATLGKVMADPGQIEQVIINLAVNARDAMPKGGRLTISTSNLTVAPEYAADRPGLEPGDYVGLSLADTGAGMDSQMVSQIFEPFFTTKKKGKGTGLGLSTVYGIIKQSGGYIEVASRVGRGTTFRVYLPRVSDAIGIDANAAYERRSSQGTETILLVEDADAVRGVSKRILLDAGYAVLEADGGEAAIEACANHDAPVDLLLTDVVMPHMSGRELAETLGPDYPEMRVLYMSGYTDDAIVHRGVFDSNVAFIEKPFTVNALLKKVREVLDQDVRRRAS